MLDSGQLHGEIIEDSWSEDFFVKISRETKYFMFLGSLVGYDSQADLSGTPHAIISGEQCVLGSSVSKE